MPFFFTKCTFLFTLYINLLPYLLTSLGRMALGSEIRSSSTKNVLYFYITVCLPTSFKTANIKDWSVDVSHITIARVGQDSSLFVHENALWCVVYQADKCKMQTFQARNAGCT